MSYKHFLKSKQVDTVYSGFECDSLNPLLFDYQKAIVQWALKKGCSALFEDTGLGKTIQQLAWAEAVSNYTKGNVLILAPLAVSKQTAKEAEKFNIKCNLCESQEDVEKGINITNYEKIHKFDTDTFIGIALDESSILKSFTSKTSMELIKLFKNTAYKLCCTATPSPNDYTEIGTTAEFLGICSRNEMLASYFINDSIKGDGWRLKRHAKDNFFRWMATWSMMIKNPSDLGFDGTKFILPKLNIKTHIIKGEADEGSLFVEYAETLNERREARKQSLDKRVDLAKTLTEKLNSCLIWCDYNNESNALKKAIDKATEVTGSDTDKHKESALMGFASGDVKFLISKPSICGFGMNWQNCNNMIFCGLSDSYEQFYQAVRRCYRFGQKKEVNVHIIISEKELNVLKNIQRKQNDHIEMSKAMIAIMSEIAKGEIFQNTKIKELYNPSIKIEIPHFLNSNQL